MKIRMKILVVVLAILLLAGGTNALSNSGGGTWQYYRDITISNSGSALTNYQVLVNFTSSNFPTSANVSGADIRFTDFGGNELSYWIESWDYTDRSAQIWVKMPSIQAGATATIRMYYENPSASSSNNGDNTFFFFDDFPGTSINWSKWNLSSTKPCSMPHDPDGLETLEIDANGNLHISEAGSYWCALRSENITFPEKWAYSVKLKVDADANFQAFGVDWTSTSFFPYDTTGTPYDRTITYDTSYEIKSANVDATNWGEYIIIRNNTGVYFYDKGSLENIHTSQVPSSGGNRTLHFTVAGGRHMYVEFVKVRKYISPEPSVSVGTEITSTNLIDVIDNGNFDADLSAWTFEDGSNTAPACTASPAYGGAIWDTGLVRLQAHSAYGNAYLHQNVSKIKPTYFKFDYNTVGGCGGTIVYLMDGNEIVFSYQVHRDTSLSTGFQQASFLGQINKYCSTLGCVEPIGTIEIYFNESSVDIYQNNILRANFSPHSSIYNVDSVKLLSANSCCDGRNDNYGYFDNISLYGVSTIYGEISPDSIGYSAFVATGQNTYVQSSYGTFGLLLKGQTKTLENSVVLNNTGDISAKVEARFNDNISGVFGLISGANLLNATNFALGQSGSLVPLDNNGADVQVGVVPSGVTALDARLGVPGEQVAGDYSGTVVLTFSNDV